MATNASEKVISKMKAVAQIFFLVPRGFVRKIGSFSIFFFSPISLSAVFVCYFGTLLSVSKEE